MKELQKNSCVKRLGLVSVSFDEVSIAVLCEYIEKSRYLEELDLSWNYLPY